ncbi:MAG: DsbA family protein [Alphaproteobacteria bacterium]|nr:DsbA family protein [Alphaproteobacteria bacterium]
MVIVDFFLGIGSRYSYLAASQVERIEATYGCRFIWKPIASGALMDRRGDNPFRGEPVSGQYDWGYREYDAKCWAAYYGIPFREPVKFRVDPVSLALACLAADRQGALVACCRLLQRLIFIDGRVIDDGALRGLAEQLGLDEPMFERDRTAPETGARHDGLLEEARSRGAFGVPTFFLGARMFWGNDRLVLLEAALIDRCDTASGARPHHVGVFDGDFSGDRFYSLPDVVGRSALNTKI